jgi:LysM repeat protein
LTHGAAPASLANSRSNEQVFPSGLTIERTQNTTNIRTNSTEHPMTATLYPSDLYPSNTHANYALRRAVAAGLLVLVLVLVTIAASASLGALLEVDGQPAAATDVAAAPIVRIHVAQPGDTLWSIAEQYRGDVGQGRFVDALIASNGGTSIQAGQAIRLP